MFDLLNCKFGCVNRGQESAGIVTSEGDCAKHFRVIKGMGMINTVFNDESMKKLTGKGYSFYQFKSCKKKNIYIYY
jgi:glutamine phosphoribosylpyrophosphate amidotransferase